MKKMMKIMSIAAGVMSLAGCASFTAERTSRFVDGNGDVVWVEYARCEEREIPFVAPTGAEMKYKSKSRVRVTMPDGTDFIAYRNMSLVGVLYKTLDKEWEFLEEGTACAVAQIADDGDGYLLRFQGVVCADGAVGDEGRKPKITGSSTPQGFGRTSSGPRPSSGPRTREGGR